MFADAPASHRRLGEPETLAFRPDGGALGTGERAIRFRYVKELRARSVLLRGTAMRTPNAPFERRVDDGGAAPRVYDAPLELEAATDGERLARRRLEQAETAAGTAHAASDCLGIEAGVVFALRGHADGALDRDWLVTSVEHRVHLSADAGPGGLRYENGFTAIPSDVAYREPNRTAKPSVGVQTALVVGPQGQEVYADDLGRVKVQFRWDREGRHDDRSSSWVRVSQAWAGAGFGALDTPRVGNEVLVDFVDGDIDRPIVVGSVYDGVNLPPVPLPQDRTTAVIRATAPASGRGHSELRFETQTGREYVYLGSRRDLRVGVGQDKTEAIARHEHATIGADAERSVAGCETVAVGADRTLTVGAAHTVTVGEDETRTIAGAERADVGGDRFVTVGGASTAIVGSISRCASAATRRSTSSVERASRQAERATSKRRASHCRPSTT